MEKEKLVSMVCAAKNGENEAITEIYEAFYNDIYYYILKTVNDSELAADLTQDSFIEIFQTIGALKEPVAFVNWSKRIAYHRCTAYFRKKRDLLLDEAEEGQSVFDTIVEEREEFIPDEALDKDELKKTIHEMIDSLPEEQRAAIMMRYFDEMSVKEIADIQGVTEGTVKSRLNYGRKAIKGSVEEYEKKNGVKLRCAGVVPLLLWLFREYRIANGMSLAGSAATATSFAKTAIDAGVITGKKVMSALTKKIVAGVTATTVVVGGVVAGILARPEEQPLQWCGYGEIFSSMSYETRYDLEIDKLDDKFISGHLEVSNLYDIVHKTEFTGKGALENDVVRYQLDFDTPFVYTILGDLKYEYSEIEILYDKKSETFVFNDFYKVVLERKNSEQDKVVIENQSWQGYGEDSLCQLYVNNHLFELNVYEMTETDISGKLIVKNGKTVEHESEFTGRGSKRDGCIHFEIKLDTPREKEISGVICAVDNFWMEYNSQTNQFEISFPCQYEVVMEQK